MCLQNMPGYLHEKYFGLKKNDVKYIFYPWFPKDIIKDFLFMGASSLFSPLNQM